ncbi:MAG: response regulator [Nitrospira sp.]|nr:response regulator [Nitrospira sp.]
MGCSALQALEHTTPNGIFLDLRMPGMDGLEVLEHIRNLLPSIPVVIITAANAPEHVLQAISAGAQTCILKPFDTSQIKQIAERWFATS